MNKRCRSETGGFKPEGRFLASACRVILFYFFNLDIEYQEEFDHEMRENTGPRSCPEWDIQEVPQARRSACSILGKAIR